MVSYISVSFLASLLAGWVLVGILRQLAVRWGLMDLPNARSSHAKPTARGGGIAIVLVTLTAVFYASTTHRISGALAAAWIIGGGLVAGVGFLDDLRGLPALVRGGVHVVAAAVLLSVVGRSALLASLSWSPGWWAGAWIVGIAAVVWSVNLFNFMDGIDGLAAAQCVFVAGSAALMVASGSGLEASALPLVAMAGAAAGFLIWNAPPAKIFMGDVGSGFVGFGLAVGALSSSGHGRVSLWTWLLLNGLFVTDATATLLTRLFRGDRIYEAHRLHVYQQLARRWFSHGRVVAIYMSINLIWCLPWAMATTRWPGSAAALAVGALVPLCLAAIVQGAGKEDP